MGHPFKTYLRPFRRRWGLTQKELAFLIGAESPTTISRLEQLKRFPSLAAGIACLVVFDTSAPEMFPGLFADIRKEVLARAAQLYDELQGNPSPATRTKLDFLEKILAQAEARKNKGA
jgi:transcriptional regulator with XRE-family HTH domain